MSFLEKISTINTTHVDSHDEGPPRFYCHNGSKQARTGCVFYTRGDQYEDEPVLPWMPSTRFEGENGFETNSLRIAIIGFRQQAFKKEDKGYVWFPEWQPGLQLYSEILCFAEGLEEAPVVWVAKGLIGKTVLGKGGIVTQYRTGLLKEAEKQAKKRLPLWTFWLPLATAVDHHGRVLYQPTGYGNNVITPPALHLPHDDHAANIEELFVGEELMTWGDELRAEYDTWLKTKRGSSDESGGSIATAQPEPSTPQEPSAFASRIKDYTPTASDDQGEDLPL